MGFGLGRRQDRGGGCAARMIRCLAVEAGAGNPAEPGRFGRAGIFAVLGRAGRRVGFSSNSGCSSRRRAPQLSHTNRRRCAYRRHLPSRHDHILNRSGAGVMHSAAFVPARGAPGHRPPRPDLGFQAGGGVLQHCYHPQPQRYRCIIPAHRGPPCDRLVSHVTDYSRAPTANQGPNPATPPSPHVFAKPLFFAFLPRSGGGGRGLTGGFTGKGSGLRGGRRRRRLSLGGRPGQEGVRTGGLSCFVGGASARRPCSSGRTSSSCLRRGAYRRQRRGRHRRIY